MDNNEWNVTQYAENINVAASRLPDFKSNEPLDKIYT